MSQNTNSSVATKAPVNEAASRGEQNLNVLFTSNQTWHTKMMAALGFVGDGKATVEQVMAFNERCKVEIEAEIAEANAEKAKVAAAKADKAPSRKTECPITRKEFTDGAKDITVVVDGKPMIATVKEFSTHSLGWYLNGKADIMVGGKKVTVQIGGNFTIIGSKELPQS